MRYRFFAVLAAALLFFSPVHAGVYILVDGATATISVAGAGVSKIIQPSSQGVGSGPLASQAFMVVTTSTTCTAQILVSNDGLSWDNYGSTIGATAQQGGTGNFAKSGSGTSPFAFFSATITAFTGTGKCTVTMSG